VGVKLSLEEYREKLLADIRFWNRVLEANLQTEKQKYALQEMINVVTVIYHDLGKIVVGGKQ